MPRGGSWPGGRIWIDAQGRKTYVIRRSINGRRFEESTRASTPRAAMKELERFELDPEGYRPGGVRESKLVLTEKLIDSHVDWKKDRGVSPEWRRDTRAYLKWWASKLGNRDLRAAKLEDFQKALDDAKSKAHRVRALKRLYTWLRETGRVGRGEDATLDLKVVAAKPALWTGKRKALGEKDFRAIFFALDPYWQLPLYVLSGSGMHVRELYRLASGNGDVSGNVITVLHKSGRPHSAEVELPIAEAAKFLMKRGPFSISRLDKAVREAARKVKLPPCGPGLIRHSVAKWTTEKGGDRKRISTWLGHQSESTTAKFYAAGATVPRPTTSVSPINVVRRRKVVVRTPRRKSESPPVTVLTPPRPPEQVKVLMPPRPPESD